MSSYPAPTETLPHFNPSVFTVDDTPLTLSDANKLYFKKSGGIITGAVSMPSLTLNGINVETRLLDIDINSNKLTDISYNNSVTYILHDLSVNGVLKLPNLTNAGSEILTNKQKTTKITYDPNTSVTTIADTLKSSSTLIVGSQNYNASDQFYKLTGISRDTSLPILTITDAVEFDGTVKTQNHTNIDDVLSNFDTILVNMEYVQETDKLIIDSNVNVNRDMVIDGSLNVTGNFQLNSISDVEQKIIDVSNTVTSNKTKLTNLSFNSGTTEIDGSLNVTGNFQLNSISDVEQKIIDVSNTVTTHETKLTNLSFNSGTTEIDGSLNVTGNFQLNSISDVEQKIIDVSNTVTTHETKLTNLSFNSGTNVTEIDGSVNITYLTLGNISNVEAKIIDISNNSSGGGGTPYISYDSVDDKLVVEKDMDLSNNYLNCRFMKRNIDVYRLSQNHNLSYLEFRSGGNYIDAFQSNSFSKTIYLQNYSGGDVVLGNPSTSTSDMTINGKLNIFESIGSFPSSSGGSLTLEHGPTPSNRASSIVFKSSLNTNDFGYIAYYDDYNNQPAGRSLLEIGVQSNSNDETTDNIDNIILSPSGYVGINTVTPRTMLDVRGNINCSEIQVNSIPINSFTNFRFGTVPGVRLKWGSGQHLPVSISQAVYSHNQQFDPNLSDDEFNCNFAYYGTYEITCNVIFKNLSTARLTPCIGIAINNDINDISGSSVSPKFTLRPHYQTPFSVQYVRMGEGKVCNLSCSRIFNFTSISQNVSINTYIERGADTTAPYYNEEIENTLYELFDASIQFKYLGNFDNITTS